MWQDRRTAARCDELKAEGREPLFRERTGLVLDPYFSGTKIEWLLKEGGVDPEAAFGTIDSWLVRKLTGRHVTDYSNASRTLLFDIRKLDWDAELCELLGVLARVAARAAPERARVRRDDRVRRQRAGGGHRRRPAGGALRPGVPLARARQEHVRDRQLRARERGRRARRRPQEGLLTTVAWGVGDRVDYALEAAIFVTGAAVQWLRDGLGIIAAADETEGSPARSTRTTASTSSPRSPGSARRTGIRTPAGRSWG